MAKITFNKLGLKQKSETKEVKIGENTIQVKQYLSSAEKSRLMEFVLNNAANSLGLFDPIRVEVTFALGIMKYYTDISFTDTQLIKNMDTTYDILDSNGVFDIVFAAIPKNEFVFMSKTIEKYVDALSKYNNSAVAIINSMKNSSEGLNTELNNILDSIKDKKGMETLTELIDIVQGKNV